MPKNFSISFPQGDIFVSKSGTARIIKNKSYENRFNNNLNKLQVYTDNKVVQELQQYVTKDTGAQELSIRLNTDCGSGIVRIGVPYARHQAYLIKRKTPNVGKRGKYPFERMKADKGQSILQQVAAYSRRLNK